MLTCDHWFHTLLLTTIARQRKKDIEQIEKFGKYSQKNVRIGYISLCVCVWGLVIWALWHINLCRLFNTK